jgi:site-specific recombinase XerD
MTPIGFRSGLADRLECFVRLRQSTGRDYRDQARLLRYFDRFLLEQHVTALPLTRAVTDRYQQTLSHLAVRTQYNRFCVVRQFCQYLALQDPRSVAPEPLRHVPSRGAYVPYIYGADQVRALLQAARTLGPAGSLRPHTIATFLGLLYATGMRTGEALALRLEDRRPDRDALYIRQGKFRKARWVPLAPSAQRALDAYVEQRTRRWPSTPADALFLNARGRPLRYGPAHGAFHQALDRTGIAHGSGPSPRLHDLRHTFAVHRLLAWYRDGQDIHARLPALATYMGHVDMRSTWVYLHRTPELMEQVDQRFHAYFLDHIHHPRAQGAQP